MHHSAALPSESVSQKYFIIHYFGYCIWSQQFEFLSVLCLIKNDPNSISGKNMDKDQT